MKIICNKNHLVHGVSIVSKAVSNKTTLPILECILIEASAGTITLTANDMELGIETTIEGTILEQGKIALDAKLFSEIVRKLPDNDITIETNKDFKATITCEKACFQIMGQEGNEFPYLPEIEREKSITLSQYSLKEIIRQTIFSISDNENTKLMTGELFEVKDNKLSVVSLDGHRISIRNIQLKESYDSFKVVVPGKTLQEIVKIISGETEEEVTIYVTSKHILFEFDNTKVVSRLLEGEYYKISQMLSSDYETKIRINKKEFLSCIDRASLLIRESDKKPIIINITDNSLQLNISSFFGTMEESIMITKEGRDLLIGFNPKFLMDVLRVIDDEEINIYLVNPKAPCFIKDDAGSYTYLILPVNFNH
ncbi:DNA polymerase III subunit beta [Anaerostipes sp. 494a]|uniref:DNA polymerase III subunit beta n=1 Tax=Anaerostipes TaxID=207244 RepID=UPI000953050C|nr:MULTISPECIES: DNA polymerase III subunit beta [Anaerostipes]MCI5623225.1 DNA polymerase III subunit beta [Anaerostipes sp.]MDY2725987.1 DNA polymerase III subunit beta [Anaerostipes faecalis]OLR59529.1 DNA polymerase III subunit beta [Anaerostipes sp. 494a]